MDGEDGSPVDHTGACVALAALLNRGIDGAEISRRYLTLACEEASADPVVVLAHMIQAGLLENRNGKLYLGTVGVAFATCAYVIG